MDTVWKDRTMRFFFFPILRQRIATFLAQRTGRLLLASKPPYCQRVETHARCSRAVDWRRERTFLF